MFSCKENRVICTAFSAELSQTYRTGLWVDSRDATSGSTLLLPRDAAAPGAECSICPKSPKNAPEEPRKPCSRSQQLPKTGIISSTSLHGRSTPISLEMQQRSQIPEETAWHLFPMKSPQKEAKQPIILDISARFPQCVWPVLGHCCALVPTLSGGCCFPPAPSEPPAGSRWGL